MPNKLVHAILVDARDRLSNAGENELFPDLADSADFLDDLAPNEDSKWSPFHPIAQDAVNSLAYTLGSMATGDHQQSVWAALCAYEAADQLAVFELAPGRTSYPEEKELLAHWAVQTELARQEQSLELIESNHLEAVLEIGTASSIFEQL